MLKTDSVPLNPYFSFLLLWISQFSFQFPYYTRGEIQDNIFFLFAHFCCSHSLFSFVNVIFPADRFLNLSHGCTFTLSSLFNHFLEEASGQVRIIWQWNHWWSLSLGYDINFFMLNKNLFFLPWIFKFPCTLKKWIILLQNIQYSQCSMSPLYKLKLDMNYKQIPKKINLCIFVFFFQ